MEKKTKILIISLVAIIIIAGIILAIQIASGNKEQPPEEAKQEEIKEEEVEVARDENVKIFTGDNRPIAVMIDNHNGAWPQAGLNKAYMVYEIIVEGGETRLMALFKGQDLEKIGPVRSSRHYFIDYALENDAIYVHHGQSPQAQEDFSNLGVDRIVASEPNTGWREKGLHVSSEHTLFSSSEKLKKGLGKKRTEYTEERYKDNYGLLLHYSPKSLDLASIPNAKVANKVDIKYSNLTTSNYEYDAEAKVYNRSVNGKAHIDRITEKQYTFKNIITYQVRNYDLNDGSGKGRQGFDNVGSGTGWYISEGYAVPIKWSKSNRKSKTVYTLEDGTELKVNDGNTFIQIQPVGQSLTIE